MNVNLIQVGRVIRAQGIKGKLRIKPSADHDLFLALKDVILVDEAGGTRPYSVISAQIHAGMVLLGVKGIATMDQAEELVGCGVYADKESFPDLPDGEYYQFQLMGLDVYAKDGLYLGNIESIFPTGSNDVYVVKSGAKEYLIPAIGDVIEEIDLSNGRIVVNSEKGLLVEE